MSRAIHTTNGDASFGFVLASGFASQACEWSISRHVLFLILVMATIAAGHIAPIKRHPCNGFRRLARTDSLASR